MGYFILRNLVTTRQIFWLGQLNPLVALVTIVLVDRHTLGNLGLRLAHLLSHLLVVLVGAAYCLLHADLAQLFRTDAAFSYVLLEDINDVIKTKVSCVKIGASHMQFGIWVSLVHPRLIHMSAGAVRVFYFFYCSNTNRLNYGIRTVFPLLGKIRLRHQIAASFFSRRLTLNRPIRWVFSNREVSYALLSQLAYWVVRRSHLLLDVVGQVAVNPLVERLIINIKRVSHN